MIVTSGTLVATYGLLALHFQSDVESATISISPAAPAEVMLVGRGNCVSAFFQQFQGVLIEWNIHDPASGNGADLSNGLAVNKDLHFTEVLCMLIKTQGRNFGRVFDLKGGTKQDRMVVTPVDGQLELAPAAVVKGRIRPALRSLPDRLEDHRAPNGGC